jgi:glutamyl/glutaminyl-tRNA synthetase
MRAMISRFAPAPTGFLHLGHVVNAIFVWGVTRARGGRVLLRIEDHDRRRSRPQFEAALLEDLAWLGFVADDGPVRQSERSGVYERALDRLRAAGLVYACACSRSDILDAVARGGSPERLALPENVARGFQPSDEIRYPGTCRDRGLPDGPGMSLRVRLDPSVERFVDLRHGAQEQRPFEQCGDLVMRDRDGSWTYQFAATVDDFDQGVTLVVRGDDLLQSTGRQLQLARLLGRRDPPAFLHHALLMKSPTQKLSKADRDSGVRDLRALGWTAARVVGHAAALAGLVAADRDIPADEVSSIMTGNL